MTGRMLHNITVKRSYLPWATLALFAVAHIVVFRLLLSIGNQVFFEEASKVFQGQLPYRDFLLEYPPLSLAVLLPPRLAGPDTWAYGRAFNYEMLVIDLGVLVFIALMSPRLRLPLWQPLAAYTAALFAAGSLASDRYDLWPALLVLAALFCFSIGKYTQCWLFLALGVAAKLYPAILAPPLIIYHIARRDFAGLRKGLVVTTAVAAVVILPWVVISPSGFWESLRYQFDRGLQMESTWASALELGAAFGLTHLSVVFETGADNVVSPLASTIARFAPLAAVLAMAGVWHAYAKAALRSPFSKAAEAPNSPRGRRGTRGLPVETGQSLPGTSVIPLDLPLTKGETPDPPRADLTTMVLFWGLAILAFLLTSKVLSPQFLLWLMPLVALAPGRERWMAWALLLVAAGLTHYVFPGGYYNLFQFRLDAVGALVMRNLLLLAIALLLLRWGLHRPRAGSSA